MRRIFLVRHGHPDFPLGAHVCLGRTDTPLGALGRMQACLLGEAPEGTSAPGNRANGNTASFTQW